METYICSSLFRNYLLTGENFFRNHLDKKTLEFFEKVSSIDGLFTTKGKYFAILNSVSLELQILLSSDNSIMKMLATTHYIYHSSECKGLLILSLKCGEEVLQLNKEDLNKLIRQKVHNNIETYRFFLDTLASQVLRSEKQGEFSYAC